MKSIVGVFLFFAGIWFVAQPAFSHSGRTDASGGHYNRKTGEYHYHGGGRKSSVSSSTTPQKTSARPPAPKGLSGQPLIGIASVIDGDTIEIHGQRIRLHGIDAPESSQICMVNGRPWRCGQEASLKLSDKIGKTTVSCDSRDTDRYGRVVAVCVAADVDLNAWLVNEGLAVAYRKYSSDYIGQELEAKANNRGIWASEFEMPWDWRKKK